MKEMIARLVGRELQFPDGTLVTVTRVEASENLRAARVFLTVFPEDEERMRAVMMLVSRAAGFIQRQLNRELRMRPVPKITFRLDQAEANRERVEEILADVNRETGD